MKNLFLFVALICLFSCTKKVGRLPVNLPVSTTKNCQFQTGSIVSYSVTIQPLINNNCGLTCHATPGSGGINLDTYASIKLLCLSGQMMPVVINTDPNNTIMPPPPQRHLDSCEIKALNIWIQQGCQNN